MELQDLRKLLATAQRERKSICKDVVLTCRKSVQKAFVIAEQDNKRKGAKLTKGFQKMGGGEAPEEGEGEAAGETKDKDEEDRSVTSRQSADTHSTVASNTTFLNNEEAVLLQQAKEAAAQKKADADADKPGD